MKVKTRARSSALAVVVAAAGCVVLAGGASAQMSITQ
jgi:hypothetical protein